MIYKILLGFAVVLLGISLYFSYEAKREKDQEINRFKKQIQDEFNEKYLNLERELHTSEMVRHNLAHRSDSLDLYSKDLVRQIDQTNTELKSVKGKYKNLTSSERAKQMTDEYERSK